MLSDRKDNDMEHKDDNANDEVRYNKQRTQTCPHTLSLNKTQGRKREKEYGYAVRAYQLLWDSLYVCMYTHMFVYV